MKTLKFGLGASLFMCLCTNLFAQTPPYRLSPKWVFGTKGFFDFTSGTLTQPNVRPAADNIIAFEGASTLCDSNKNVMVYDNNVRVAGSNFTPLTNYMQSSSSSTQGGLILPNPANPKKDFFWITGNAESTYTGAEANDDDKEGIKVYKGSQSGSSVTNPNWVVDLEPDPIREALYSSTDGAYGYWIVTGKLNVSANPAIVEISSWPIPTTGVVGAKVSSTGSTGAATWSEFAQTSVKINRCQNKIAFVTYNAITVLNWDRTTGKVGSVIKSFNNVNVGPSGSKLYGCEFSPNGNYLYASTLGDWTGTGGDLIVINLNAAGGTGTGLSYKTGQIAKGSLQLGPDDIIYVANGGDATSVSSIGTITNPDGGGTYNPTGLTLANGASVRLGMSNIPWLNPRVPTISSVYNGSCGKYTFTPSFLTHFKENVGVDEAVWDFGDGSAKVTNTLAAADDPVTHVFGGTAGTNMTITVTLKDATCGHYWKGTLTQNIPCTLPIELISFSGEATGRSIQLNWSTSKEVNNKYFEIQRSVDGRNFETIGTVNGNGDRSSISNYTFNDNDPNLGTNYYRLVQFDFNGTSEISGVTAVSMTEYLIQVYPNPTEGDFTMNLPKAENAILVIYDLLGKEVVRADLTNSSSTTYTFGRDLAKGTYILKYMDEIEIKSIKIEKR